MGLSTDRIVNGSTSAEEHLLCSICHEILWHPVACVTREHSFCEVCLSQWLARQQRCPNTCEYQQRARPPYPLTQLLSQLKVTCKNTVNGCADIISYELLEKHEQMCGYEMKKCQGCLQSLLKQDLDRHELQCDQLEILCDNCRMTYRRRDGHGAIDCLRNQMKNQSDLFERKLTALEQNVQRQTELLCRMDQQQKGLIERLDEQAKEAEQKTRKIVRFDDVPLSIVDPATRKPINHYCGFVWIGCKFISRTDGESARCLNAFKPAQQHVVYSKLGPRVYGGPQNSISISSINKGQTFSVQSLEALLITNLSLYETFISGMKDNKTCFTRKIQSQNELQRIELNWNDIDALTIPIGSQNEQNEIFVISEIVFTHQ